MGRLRTWAPDEQVALLFVVLFGTLALVSLVSLLLSVRDHPVGSEASRDRFKRDLRAVWIGMILFWLAWMSGPVGGTIFFGLVSFIALREFISLQHTRRSDHRTLILAFFIVLPLQYVIVGASAFDLFTVFVPVYVFFAVPVVSALAGDPHRFLERNAKIQWGLVVCVYGLSHAPALLLLDLGRFVDRGAFLLFFLVVVTVVAHFVQEAAGRWMRKRPVARAISRTFSWRSWFIGAFVAAWVGAFMYWMTPFKPGQALLMAFIAAGAGTLGEFVMQALKRDSGVTNWSNHASITGAVGLLDRIAPLCFAAPVFFHSVRWYFKFYA
jgi:phosphatidate cytidylyltransferase